MIIPAILEQSVEEVQKKINRVADFVDRVQIDIIDEHKTVDLHELLDVQFGDLSLDVHLMADNPEKLLEECSDIAKKAQSVRAIGQIERMMDQGIFVRKAHELKLEAGLALDLYTPISSLDINARESADCILLMSVKAGFAGQHFDHRVIEKIKELRDTPYKGAIVIDGGLDLSHLQVCKSAGANEFAVGSYLWEHEDIARVIPSDPSADGERGNLP